MEVRQPGLQTTVQDAGRQVRALGVPAGGAADPVARRLGNALVGNGPGAAGLEVT
ncbi:allophanate hydrolase, partial [Deinococcus sp. 23YEL01]|nr:allophanate hydrolase [Deinococcus sp. 23YEL01]